MAVADSNEHDRLDPRDREYVKTLEADERDVVVASLLRYRREPQLGVGDRLPALDLLGLEDGRRVRLGDLLGGRPLVLVFGSFTWPPFRRRSGDVQQFYERFRESASFAFVYIAEAHASDEWQLQANLDDDVLIAQHRTLDERFEAAHRTARRLGLTMPMLVDGMDDAVSEAFAAWPERIYVVGADARIAFAGGPGPFEFDPEAAESALEENLAGS